MVSCFLVETLSSLGDSFPSNLIVVSVSLSLSTIESSATGYFCLLTPKRESKFSAFAVGELLSPSGAA
jgi:hypothetical protein